MKTTPDKLFQTLTPNGAVRVLVGTLVDRLRQVRPDVADCRVSVEKASPAGIGRFYRVRVEVRRVSGGMLTIRRDAQPGLRRERLQTAVREAFEAVDRALSAAPAALRQASPMLEGRVERLFRREGYGFVRTAGGTTVYFRAGAVRDRGFLRLAVGSRVRCEAARGSLGDRARRVEIVEGDGGRWPEAAAPADLVAGARTGRPSADPRPDAGNEGSAS